MNIAHWLADAALQHPSSPALMIGERVEADYATFARRARGVAGLLADRGVRAGNRVAVFMGNCTEYLECLYGIWWLGAVAVPVNAKLHGNEAAWIVEHAQASLAFVSDGLREALPIELSPRLLCLGTPGFKSVEDVPGLEVPARRASSDLAWLFYTSGTTGRPKGAMLSHGNLVAMSLSYLADVDSVDPGDAVLYAAPLSHGAGLYNFIHVRRAARHVIPPSGGFDADEVLSLAERLRNVSMFAAPTMVKRLVEAARQRQHHGDGLKTVVYGGGPMYLADIQDALSTLGQRFVQIYGQGESPMTITALARHWHNDDGHPRHRARLASVGTAHSVVRVRVAGPDCRSCRRTTTARCSSAPCATSSVLPERSHESHRIRRIPADRTRAVAVRDRAAQA